MHIDIAHYEVDNVPFIQWWTDANRSNIAFYPDHENKFVYWYGKGADNEHVGCPVFDY